MVGRVVLRSPWPCGPLVFGSGGGLLSRLARASSQRHADRHRDAAAETLFKARLEQHDPALVWVKPEEFGERLHRQGAMTSVGTKFALKRLRDKVKVANPIDPPAEQLTDTPHER
ncbi:hypothetical protein ACFQ60_00595 [Streptomyces zhihengii]|uniref:Uncharacterized protein n=1 Tax=Streptomyces zhihengii TaxID=1818004 RepID=A0ABS2V3R1_9ACTN|nr:hypothetical protein [Streptomyces zhihengii]MBM9624385.1 hypothetical protein [Streptomyces zhihengii]